MGRSWTVHLIILWLLIIISAAPFVRSQFKFRNATCADEFPRIAIQWSEWPTNDDSFSQYNLIATNSCSPSIFASMDTNSNIAVAVDSESETVCGRGYWEKRKFSCKTLKGEILIHEKDLPEPTVKNDYMIKFDPYGRNLYWKQRDDSDGHIFVTDVRTKVSKVVVPHPGDLHTLAVDGINGVIFWMSEDTIYKVILDGREKPGKLEVANAGENAIEMTVDWANELIYWCSHREIVRTNYNGEKRETYTFRSSDSEPDHPFGGIRYFSLRVYEDDIYFVRGNDEAGHVLCKFNWATKEEVERFFGIFKHNTRSLEIYEKSSRITENPCDQLQCSHLCLPFDSPGFRCACPSYMTQVGNKCKAAPVSFLIEDKRMGNSSSLVLVKSPEEIGLASTGMSFTEAFIDADFGILNSWDMRVICYKSGSKSDSDIIKCHGSELAGENGTRIGRINGTIISASFDGKVGKVFWAEAKSKCVKMMNVEDGIVWTVFCSVDMDTEFVAIDQDRWILFWRNSRGNGIEKVDLEIHTSQNLFNDDELLIPIANVGIGICVDPKNELIVWLTKEKIKWMNYFGNDQGEFMMPTGTKSISNIQCDTKRLYWIEVTETKHTYLATLSLVDRIMERIFRSEPGSRIQKFSLGRMEKPEISQRCQLTKCSYGCVPIFESTQRRQKFKCICPKGMILKNVTFCENSRFLIATKSEKISEQIHLDDQEGSIWRSPKSLTTTSQFSFAATSSTTCWLANNLLQCQMKEEAAKVVGAVTATAPVIGLNLKGNQIYWNTNQTGCFKVTALETNASLTFGCFNISNDATDPIVLDSVRSTLLWCENDANSLKAKALHDDQDIGTFIYRSADLGTCTGIAVDVFEERLFVILSNDIISLKYRGSARVSLVEPAIIRSLSLNVHYRKLVYQNNRLYWIGYESSGGKEFVELMALVTSTIATDPLRLYETEPGSTIADFLPYDFPTKETISSDPCFTRVCPGFCFINNPLLASVGGAVCKCPDGSQLKNHLCQPETIAGSSVPELIAIIIPSLIAVIVLLCVLVAFVRFRRKSEVIQLLEGNPNAVGNGDGEADRLPFTRIIPAEAVQVKRNSILGEGNFGIVYAGKYGTQKVAIKTLKSSENDKELLRQFVRELKVMETVGDHDHIVKFFGAEISGIKKGNVLVLLELSPFGCLEKYLRKYANNFVEYVEIKESEDYENIEYVNTGESSPQDHVVKLSLPLFMYWARQIASGMSYLERKNVVHGDLAARNILIFQDNFLKISDFGYSRNLYQYTSYMKRNAVPLPWRWASIETLERLEFSCKADVWAYGVTLWEIFSLGNIPYPNLAWTDDFVEKLKSEFRLKKPDKAPDKIYQDILRKCWELQPEDRPTFDFMEKYFMNFMTSLPELAPSWNISYVNVELGDAEIQYCNVLRQ